MSDTFGSLAPPDPLLRPPRNPARMPQGVEDVAAGMTTEPIADAIKALRGGMTPTEAQNFAMTAAVGLISPMARGVKPVTQGIKAYHGSPHDFERFDISKIGTGEGAQSYGHGLYFAGNEATAKSYRDTFAKQNTPTAGVTDGWVTSGIGETARRLLSAHGNIDSAIEGALYRAGGGRGADMYADAARQLQEVKKQGKLPAPAHMYEVNIAAKPEQFLDWDKPLAKMSPEVQAALKRTGFDTPGAHLANVIGGPKNLTGEAAYRALTGVEPGSAAAGIGAGKEVATAALREAGIPGIKYLDQGSRPLGDEVTKLEHALTNAQKYSTKDVPEIERALATAQEKAKTGSSNYVLFDDKLVDILRKYMVPGMVAGPAAAGASFGSLAPDSGGQ